VEYTAETPGEYLLNVTLHGQPIKDAPFHPFIKPSANADNSYAEGPGLREAFDNEPAHFTIHSVDKWGNPRTDGGDDFKVDINGPETITPQIVDNNDGTYAVTYHPDKTGTYKINVTLEGRPIKDAPFTVECKPGTDEKNTTLSRMSFTIQTRDKNGQDKNFGGDDFAVEGKHASSGQALAVRTRDNNDGTYTAEFELNQRGQYQFNISFNGKLLACSPLQLEY